jgi:hypothetical protein
MKQPRSRHKRTQAPPLLVAAAAAVTDPRYDVSVPPAQPHLHAKRQSLADVCNAAYWRQLCPQLHVCDAAFVAQHSAALSLPAPRLQDLRQQVDAAGVAQVWCVLAWHVCRPLARVHTHACVCLRVWRVCARAGRPSCRHSTAHPPTRRQPIRHHRRGLRWAPASCRGPWTCRRSLTPWSRCCGTAGRPRSL